MIADTTQALLQQLLLRADTLIAHLQTTHQHQLLIEPDWSVSIAFRYRRTRAGGAQLMPVAHVAPMALDDLQEIDDQKEKIRRNTEHFMKGLPANNVLLTGARGTGKSSGFQQLVTPQLLRDSLQGGAAEASRVPRYIRGMYAAA